MFFPKINFLLSVKNLKLLFNNNNTMYLMEDLYSKKIMVMDTEYDTSPKRLLSLAFIIYQFIDSAWKVVKSSIQYVKHDEDIFKVDENGEAFKYHKLNNKYLQENGVDIIELIDNFSTNLEEVDILLGQNIIVNKHMSWTW